MKRWTLRITICLILGVVMTVAVAFVAVLIRPRLPVQVDVVAFNSSGIRGRLDHDSARWRQLERWYHYTRNHQGWGYPHLVTARFNFGYDREEYVNEAFATRRTHPERFELVRHVAGWPFGAFEGWHASWPAQSATPSNQLMRAESSLGLIPLNLRGWFPTVADVYPVLPVLDGLLVNTFVFGLLWFGLLYWRFVRDEVRRLAHRRQGRCPRCGYDLRGEFKEGCSECGWRRGD